jgi:hypothetical protein
MLTMIPSPTRVLGAVLLLLALSLLNGCAATALRVRPWDRDLLAEKKMRFVPDPMVQAIDDHIYFSKEGSMGGRQLGGGGCGCN